MPRASKDSLQIQAPVKISTCLPAAFILKDGDKRIPIWPNPPKPSAGDLPTFCPKGDHGAIVALFRVHLHQHPEIPLNDEAGTHLTPEEIHEGAARSMYEYCFRNDLAQVWAYLWNRWYTPAQWRLWARSAHPAIPRIKTTMIVESLWKNIKHRDLAEFNHPRLDLVTHLVIENVLPRAVRTLSSIDGLRRIGRPKALAGWQTEMRADWLDMSKCDEQRCLERELKWLKQPSNMRGRTERLAELEEEEARPRGTYATNVAHWTCSCPAYLISRFLLCKHLVRSVNDRLNDDPLTNLRFFLNLRRQHYPPFYTIPGIHETASDDATISIQDVGAAVESGMGGIDESHKTGGNQDLEIGIHAQISGPDTDDGAGSGEDDQDLAACARRSSTAAGAGIDVDGRVNGVHDEGELDDEQGQPSHEKSTNAARVRLLLLLYVYAIAQHLCPKRCIILRLNEYITSSVSMTSLVLQEHPVVYIQS
jgi:hypothetical protein